MGRESTPSTEEGGTGLPLRFCQQSWDEESWLLSYRLGEVPLLSVRLPAGQTPHYRRYSDGNIQSAPLVQQVFVSVDEGCDAEALFFLGPEAVCMRARRAREEEAILGQVGRPLLYGVPGLYDVTQDLLVSWSGANWHWMGDELTPAWYDPSSGQVTDRSPGPSAVPGLAARMGLELSAAPWYVELRYLYYREHLGFSHHAPWRRRPRLDPITGWCSWEAYHGDVTADGVGESVEFLREHLKDYGLEYVQIDDGYQRTPIPPHEDGSLADSWLVPNEKFPNGHADIAGRAASAGFTPGIWTGVQITNAAFAARDGNGLLDRNGSPFEGRWIGYVPSCWADFLKKNVSSTYGALRAQGYRYFKADALRHLLYDGLLAAAAQGLLTPEEARSRFRRYIESLREGIGEDAFLLSCWGVLSEAVGLADGCRIATDANPSWGSLVMQIRESARWFHTQRILFQNDPDHVCVRADLSWARSLLSLTSLSGGLFMLSDAVEHYRGERLACIRKTIPAQPVMAAETGALETGIPAYPSIPPVLRTAADLTLEDALTVMSREGGALRAHPFSSLWAVHYRTADRRWCVVGRFAVIPLAAGEIHLDALGLDPTERYHAFDFWRERYLGSVHGRLPCDALALGSCQIVGLVPVKDRPAYLADNRHLSFGLGFVAGERWDGAELTLELRGVKDAAFSCWLTVPRAYVLRETRVEAVKVVRREEHRGRGVLEMELRFARAEGRLVLRFAEQ